MLLSTNIEKEEEKIKKKKYQLICYGIGVSASFERVGVSRMRDFFVM